MPRRRRSFFFNNRHKKLLTNTTDTVKTSRTVATAGLELEGYLDTGGYHIDMGTNNVTDTKVGQWDTAYGWGNHASAGYSTTTYSNSDVDSHLNQSNPTSGYVLSWNGSDYAWVAQSTGFSGNYNDLTNKPTIPTNNNQLTNGAGYLTDEFISDEGTYTSDLDSLTAGSDQGFYHWGSTQPTNTPGWNYGGVFVLRDNNQNIQLAIGNSGNGTQRLAIRRADGGSFTGNSWTEFWSTGNDGSGSGLDADTLDGIQGANFLRSDTTDTTSGDLQVDGDLQSKSQIRAQGWWNTATGSYGDTAVEIGMSSSTGYILVYNRNTSSYADLVIQPASINLNPVSNGAVNIKGATAWHAGNDGSGSGLDADTVDGVHASSFALRDANHNIDMNNYAITNLNDLSFNDPGPNEGIKWLGGSDWRIYESPDNLTTNSGGNLQFVTGTTRRMTLNTSGNLQTYSYQGHSNVAGTGNASYHPSGVYSTGTNWLYGTLYTNNNSIQAGSGGVVCGTITASGVIDANAGAGAINITNSDIRSSATSNWTGNPGANGKIQYHSNRWYIVADSSSNRIVQFRRDSSDLSYIDNNGTFIGNISGSAGSVAWSNVTGAPAFITNGSNYNVNNEWLRENGDNADVKLYGNSRQMTFRTDGVSGGTGGHTGYPFRWTYGGNASGNTEMLLNTSGQLWTANYGWLHDAFLRKNATDTQTNSINMNGYFIGGADGHREKGIYGNYNSYRMNNIWSMGTSYKISSDGLGFGNLYGMAYTYHNRVYTSNTMGQYHQMVWCNNGTPYCALGRNVWTSGNVTAYSDIRVKENLERIPDALEKVKRLNGYTFDRTDVETDNEGNTPKKRQSGVVAQEVLEVLPEVVSGNEEDPDGHLSVAYGNMVGLLIEAIKEQQEQIEELKARLQ